MSEVIREFSPRAILLGLILGFVFAVGNAYLGLKVGMTVSASIPAAVMSMAVLRFFPTRGTIQESNIVQTIASAGEALAAGVIFTIPALTFIGAPAPLWQISVLALLGGVIGVMMMIPLRHHLIVAEHGHLPYPEGTACAKILEAREGSRQKAFLILWGIVLGALDKGLMGIARLYHESVSWTAARLFTFSIDTTPALVGVGYLIGAKYALVMFAGGLLAWWVLIPIMAIFGLDQVIYPGTIPIREMATEDIWSNYVRYIGTGAVAMGGMLSLIRLLPVLFSSLRGHIRLMFADALRKVSKERTDRDLSFLWVIVGTIVSLLLLAFIPGISLNWLAILLVLLLGFLFVGLTSVTVGLVGSSSNPVSGMMILTLLITSGLFLALNWTSAPYLVMALMTGAVIGVAIAVAGDTSQDLKTGFLVQATPKWQQIGMLIGLIIPSIIMGYVLRLLDKSYGFGTDALPAPQATLMALVVKGVVQESLPFALVIAGLVLGIAVELLGIRALPFALGIYLPVAITTSIAVGGILHAAINRFAPRKESIEQGILLGSGLVAGDALMGVLIALLTVVRVISPDVHILAPRFVSIIVYILMLLGYVLPTLLVRSRTD